MPFNNIYLERTKIMYYLVTGAAIGAVYSVFEYIIRNNLGHSIPYLPLLARAVAAGAVIYSSVLLLNSYLSSKIPNRPFLEVITYKSILITLMIMLWLLIVNSAWYSLNPSETFSSQFDRYISEMFMINLGVCCALIIVLVTLGQINSLHRRGELLKYIIGRYHHPKEVMQAFCFIDLKGSTAITEKIGDEKYAHFLKDYYSDISDAILLTDAEVYQYVGDEIVLSWNYDTGFRNNNIINCYFLMKQHIENLKDSYLEKYGCFPEFRAGLHGGKVIVTWVGKVKKEIVYIGDVLNTTARIQEDCKRLGRDFLVSGTLLNEIADLGDIKAEFVEETVPRGKVQQVKLYSLELAQPED